MKGTIYIYDDDESKETTTELYFNERYISSWYVNVEGELNVTIDGQMFTFIPDIKIMNYLQDIF